jgi:hypothetical protein
MGRIRLLVRHTVDRVCDDIGSIDCLENGLVAMICRGNEGLF